MPNSKALIEGKFFSSGNLTSSGIMVIVKSMAQVLEGIVDIGEFDPSTGTIYLHGAEFSPRHTYDVTYYFCTYDAS